MKQKVSILNSHRLNYYRQYRLYRNLNHTDNIWSILDKKTGRVSNRISKDEIGILHDCVFVVQKGGRNRVLKQKRKSVHAFVEFSRFDIFKEVKINLLIGKKVSYNPFRSGDFHMERGQIPAHINEIFATGQGLFQMKGSKITS